jgi:hypothetical protein
MTSPFTNVGADPITRYRAVAIAAVAGARQQAPVLGYLRLGADQHVYLFPSAHDARAWFDQRQSASDHDYVAVFSSADLRAPVIEDFGSAVVSGCFPAQVGNFLPFMLGVPAGALGGYFYRRWQESHPGKLIPWISGEPWMDIVGSEPWLDIIGSEPWMDIIGSEPWVDIVGRDSAIGSHPWADIVDPGLPRFVKRGPWIDIVGAEDGDAVRRRMWLRTRALIRSATRETLVADRSLGAAAYVWYLDPSGASQAIPQPSYDEALNYSRGLIQEGYVAVAAFDKASPHWPKTPVNWHQSADPAYEGVIAQLIARYAPARTAGVGGPWVDMVGAQPWQTIVGAGPWQTIVGAGPWQTIVGAGPWQTIVGQAHEVLRRQAKAAADELPGRVIGTLRDGGGRWQVKQFRSSDDADDWFGRATREPSSFTYAAYFDKNDVTYPDPLNEQIGRARSTAAVRGEAAVSGPSINDLTDCLFHLQYPEAPAHLDPADPGHQAWIVVWHRLHAYVVKRGSIYGGTPINDLTDCAFYRRYPTAPPKLHPSDPAHQELIAEWHDIRRQLEGAA